MLIESLYYLLHNSLVDHHKYVSNKRSYHKICRISNRICQENGLATIITWNCYDKRFALIYLIANLCFLCLDKKIHSFFQISVHNFSVWVGLSGHSFDVVILYIFFQFFAASAWAEEASKSNMTPDFANSLTNAHELFLYVPTWYIVNSVLLSYTILFSFSGRRSYNHVIRFNLSTAFLSNCPFSMLQPQICNIFWKRNMKMFFKILRYIFFRKMELFPKFL